MGKSNVEDCRELYDAVRQTVKQIRHGSPLRLLVTGYRDWTDETVVQAVQYGVAAAVGGPVHQTDGACASGGLDVIAFVFAEFHMHSRGWTTRRIPADWFPGWRSSGRNPGHERNQKMVDLGHDICIGFPHPGKSSGTWDCLTRAYLAGIPAYAVMRRGGRWKLERFEPRRTRPDQATIDFTS